MLSEYIIHVLIFRPMFVHQLPRIPARLVLELDEVGMVYSVLPWDGW